MITRIVERKDGAAVVLNRIGGAAGGWPGGRAAWGFWTKVSKRPDGCWYWLGYRNKDGAGKFCTVRDGRSVSLVAHREAWRLMRPDEPLGAHQTLARKDTSRCPEHCVNPAHREPIDRHALGQRSGGLGTPCDHFGEWSTRAKLRDDQVRFIYANCREYGSQPLLARLFGVSRVTIGQIKYHRTWTHLTGRNVTGNVERISLRALRSLVEQREAERAEDHAAVLRHAAEARSAT